MIPSQDIKPRVGMWMTKTEQVNWEYIVRRSLV